MKALILAGGYGKRLRPYTDSVPKPLLEILGKPIMVWQFEWLLKNGINEIIVCAGYLKEKIIEKVGNGSRFGVKVGYAVEEEPLGKAGAIKNSEHLLKGDKSFLVINGDVITDLDPKPLIDTLKEGFVGVIAVTPLPSPYGIVKYERETKRVLAFLEKPRLKDYWINAGVYAFTQEIFEYLPEKGEIEDATFPELAKKGKLAVVEYENVSWVSVDSHKDLEEAAKLLERKSVT
ncbi:nucleotidyltransferase [Candidatus Marsarchaeota G2 archaeon ECH_B_SAG-F08]|jgi:NDP-sugar pyrophosphorylase family protein|uniref:Nucleotidyltransferase n=4 Tax=Candidatus Marsarchaeota TaxID=1978152 RepID=A0A2R6BPT5_9ARCH|nr:MAG: nucleotidyltransferase [Candidatus Marsarchaeota G1 archaeon OSP_D]PSN89287.1 MAG: nucleotidyltransferase [Candidatus Marsarchaeota G1 archaeon OSP_C]PSO00648.1 MAG: nucleotidyltransferase [Candidatus Marsarchaeota G2 archaeon ECH_B_SAG-F08]PSO05841.1 MAG: nucleotidyltransferase [Candidatus Marsarchaeota G2 archaeon ECH_B_SAG-G16]